MLSKKQIKHLRIFQMAVSEEIQSLPNDPDAEEEKNYLWGCNQVNMAIPALINGADPHEVFFKHHSGHVEFLFEVIGIDIE